MRHAALPRLARKTAALMASRLHRKFRWQLAAYFERPKSSDASGYPDLHSSSCCLTLAGCESQLRLLLAASVLSTWRRKSSAAARTCGRSPTARCRSRPCRGRPFRILTIVDCHTREALVTCARTKFRAYQVIEELDRLARIRGKPRSIRVDNGPEFAGRMLDQWAYLNKIELDFSRPGKPTDNGFIEAFNGRLRAECLNASWFVSMADARQRIEEWRTDYNTERPHMAIGGLTPMAYADQIHRARKFA